MWLYVPAVALAASIALHTAHADMFVYLDRNPAMYALLPVLLVLCVLVAAAVTCLCIVLCRRHSRTKAKVRPTPSGTVDKAALSRSPSPTRSRSTLSTRTASSPHTQQHDKPTGAPQLPQSPSDTQRSVVTPPVHSAHAESVEPTESEAALERILHPDTDATGVSGTVPYDEVEMLQHGMVDKHCHHMPWARWIHDKDYDVTITTDPHTQWSQVSLSISAVDRPSAVALAERINTDIAQHRHTCHSQRSQTQTDIDRGATPDEPKDALTSSGSALAASGTATGTTASTGASGESGAKPMLSKSSSKYVAMHIKWDDEPAATDGKSVSTGKGTVTPLASATASRSSMSVAMSCDTPRTQHKLIDDLTPMHMADGHTVPQLY